MRNADLNRLIEALKKKEAELAQRLDREKAPLKRRHLKIELKVAQMQHAKALKRCRELQDDSAPAHGRGPPARVR